MMPLSKGVANPDTQANLVVEMGWQLNLCYFVLYIIIQPNPKLMALRGLIPLGVCGEAMEVGSVLGS